jgi:hypothetical protein
MKIHVMKRHGGFENSIRIKPQQNREIYIKFDHVKTYSDTKEINFITAAGGITATITDPEWYQPIKDELEAAGL